MSEKTMDRAEALAILHEYVEDPGLRRHMLAAEAAMRGYAARLGHDPEPWGLAGLLHDFDWEIHPTIDRHPKDGAPILRARGLGEEAIHAILAHNPAGTGVPQEAPIDFALMACDEITGLIIAATLVRPAKDIGQMTVKSVQRNWKDKTVASPEVNNRLQVRVPIASLEEWAETQRALERVYGINEVILHSLSPGEARVDLLFSGDERRLRLALEQAGVTLSTPRFSGAGFEGAAEALVYDLYLNRFRPQEGRM